MPTRICGVIKFFSNEYFTKNTTARNNTKPPTQAKSLTPRNFSQFRAGAGEGGAGDGATGSGRGAATGIGGGATGRDSTGCGTGIGGGVVGCAAAGSGRRTGSARNASSR